MKDHSQSTDDVVIFFVDNEYDISGTPTVHLYTQRLVGTSEHCLTNPMMLSGFTESSAIMALDPCLGSGTTTIELFGIDYEWMNGLQTGDEDDRRRRLDGDESQAVGYRYSFTTGQFGDWTSQAVFAGLDGSSSNVNSLLSTMNVWVGKGKCDTNDGLRNQDSIIYIATSFGRSYT